MNVFTNETIASNYDSYYKTPMGSKIDKIEKDVISVFLHQVPAHSVLELGCGTGHWSKFLSEMGYRVTAIDISDAMLAIAREKEIDDVKFIKADAKALPFVSECYDFIFSIAMLEFTGNVPKVLDEIFRVLKPDGYLLLGCLNINSEIGKSKDKDETFKNAHFFSRDELVSILSYYGKTSISECAYLTSSSEILDGKLDKYPVEGAFLAALVRKTN